jgi:hypothetical protein
MGKLTALGAVFVLSLFVFLWYYEYIEILCVSTQLCTASDVQSHEILHTKRADIFLATPSGGTDQNNAVGNPDKTPEKASNIINFNMNVIPETETQPVHGGKANVTGERTKIERTQESNLTGNSSNTTKKSLELESESSPMRNVMPPERDPLETEPTPGDKQIIFIETRCILNNADVSNEHGLSLHTRQACAIESAANMNPGYKVYLLYSCPMNGRFEESSPYVQSLLAYPNVKLWKLNVTGLLSKTPLEKWNFEAAIASSHWPMEHSSDVIRILTLWKYGGIYLDLDILVLK